MEIQKLNWDSAFFGYPVGRVDMNSIGSFDFTGLHKDLMKYKLVYIFSKKELANLPDSIHLVDKKVVFKKLTNQYKASNDFSKIHSFSGPINDELKTLALESGIYSRFRVDQNFRDHEFERLYERWITESITRNNAFDVFVYKECERFAGFITLGEKNEIADIGLVAVSEQFRGRKIGSLLVDFATGAANELGYSEIQVVTQLQNLAAVKLYEGTGFRLNDLTYIYHYWNS